MELIYFNIFFIFYIFFLKYRNRQYIKKNLNLKNRIIANSSDQKKYIREIQNLHINIKSSDKNFDEIKKTYDSMIYEFNLYKEMIVDLQNKNEKLLKSETKYKSLYTNFFDKSNNLNSSYNSLSRDMDKLANSYKDLYENHKTLKNDYEELLEKNNALEQKCVDLDSELFVYQNNSQWNRINLLEEIDKKQKIQLLKLRNVLKKKEK
ncbi:uncharacterized protein METZ01_LOCUS92040, partial [marine metagenome]